MAIKLQSVAKKICTIFRIQKNLRTIQILKFLDIAEVYKI